MNLIRPELRDAFWRWREVIGTLAVASLGLWLIWLGGFLLVPLGAIVSASALFLSVLALRRLRFAQGTDAPGIVSVDEGQIAYFGPEAGGFVSVRELVELRLVRLNGRRHWRLKQADGQALLVPVEAEGAEALFDAFATLPGLDTQALVAALDRPSPTGRAQNGAGLPALSGMDPGAVIWKRPLSVTRR
ncbi:hypothetical protein E7811_05290 [Aliigemmobacter aestuarii]|uniref:Uncharacterized protein n=1 Tax=Aliigemmobacter aestuarii TaxID=1445661 RepID=A0A4S3MRK6_9RHOB|nr:hypothetical protein [Gemmobacter aestuarii]THD85128.1 hypothetical protein E7811_05290 [Gemmobacter aestuarii]